MHSIIVNTSRLSFTHCTRVFELIFGRLHFVSLWVYRFKNDEWHEHLHLAIHSAHIRFQACIVVNRIHPIWILLASIIGMNLSILKCRCAFSLKRIFEMYSGIENADFVLDEVNVWHWFIELLWNGIQNWHFTMLLNR